jgi:hypothetical protein
MQQHSYPSHSKHLVLPVAPLSGFTMLLMVEAALEPGPFMLTGAPWVEVHILRKGVSRSLYWMRCVRGVIGYRSYQWVSFEVQQLEWEDRRSQIADEKTHRM